MARLTITRWSPDTCGCVIDFEWDRDLLATSRVHTGKNIVKDCPDHSGLKTPTAFYDAILDENQRKNKVRQDILENVSALAETKDGELTFKDGITLSWSWEGKDDERILHLTVTGFTLNQGQKNAITTIANSRFGIDKVVFD